MVSSWRASFIFTLFTAAFAIIIFRLFYWQILSADRLQKQAASQHFVELAVPAIRGGIYDRDSNPIVINQPAFLVYAESRLIPDIRAFVKAVGSVLSLDLDGLTADVSDPHRVWVPLAHKVELEKVAELKKLNLKGLGFEKEPKRYYSEASTAAQILGFLGSDVNGVDRGYFGLEGYYDRQLRGTQGIVRLEKDAKGTPILIGEEERLPPQDGRSLILWMDKAIQQIVERRLADGMEKYGAKQGSVVILDPATGGVIAMASLPSYDPRAFSDYDKSLYTNPVVADSYEPGSTFKALVMAAAVDRNAVAPDTVMDENGPVPIGPYFIRTWNNEYHGKITMTQVLEYSSNVGMVYVAQKLGKDALLSAIKTFGFGQPTHIDLEDESSPDLRKDSQWKEIDLYTASFGQGIAVTPIQMVRAVAALANGGRMMEPHVVQAIKDEHGTIIPIAPKKTSQVMKPETARIITEMLVAAVDKGEAQFAKPKGYRIAGKTGTAQIPVAGHYDATKTIASFVGYAPADTPKFVMLVTLREPSSSQWGSETAAPLFFNIARDLFRYWGISPQ